VRVENVLPRSGELHRDYRRGWPVLDIPGILVTECGMLLILLVSPALVSYIGDLRGVEVPNSRNAQGITVNNWQEEALLQGITLYFSQRCPERQHS